MPYQALQPNDLFAYTGQLKNQISSQPHFTIKLQIDHRLPNSQHSCGVNKNPALLQPFLAVPAMHSWHPASEDTSMPILF
jgi:hypothetical protein